MSQGIKTSSFKTAEFHLALYTEPFICLFYTIVSKPIRLTVRHWLGSFFLHCLLLLYPERQYEIGQIRPLCGGGHSTESPILPQTRERERENIETCMKDKASKSGKVCSFSEMCVQSGRLARGGRFPGGPRCGGGLSMCRFQQFGGAREWPPTPSVS